MGYTYPYPRPAVTVDVILEVLGELLLIQRKHDPFKNKWALPGGFLDMEETLEEAAVREMKEETNIQLTTIAQFKTYSNIQRDPRGRTISTVFVASLSQKPETAKALDDAIELAWFSLNNLPDLAFDHALIIADYIKTHQLSIK